jgi:hypothetical protein
MPLFSSTRTFKGQNYSKLKDECRKKGNLFIDTEFPPDDRSVFYSQGKMADVVWKRPKVMKHTKQLAKRFHQNILELEYIFRMYIVCLYTFIIMM